MDYNVKETYKIKEESSPLLRKLSLLLIFNPKLQLKLLAGL